MQRIRLHSQGPEVSALIYGVWRWRDSAGLLPLARAEEIVDTCLALGIHTFDHADIYGDYTIEAHFGQLLANRPSLRQQLVLVTKCGIRLLGQAHPEHRVKHYDCSPAAITTAVERSLTKLRTDYLDLLLLHRPDPLLRAEATARTLCELVHSGKVRHVGVSNYTNEQFQLLAAFMDSKVPLVTNQLELHLLRPEPLIDGSLDFLQRLRTRPMAWSPLGGGRLWGSEPAAERVRQVAERLAPAYGNASLDQLALAWLRMLPSEPVPVLGTNRIERIRAAAQALSIQLDLQDWYMLYEAALGHPVP